MIALAISCSSFAQTDLDVYRYNLSEVSGSARYMGLGGSMSALGGDFSAIANNPAGLATFRNDEFGIGFMLNNQSSTGYLNDGVVNDGRFSMNMPTLGLAKVTNTSGDWNRFTFGFGYNQTASFSGSYTGLGYNDQSSRTYAFLENAQGTRPENLNTFSAEYLAFQTYVIDTSSGANYFVYNPSAGQDQYLNIDRNGRSGEVYIGFAGTYQEKLQIGVNLGFPSFRSEESRFYSESNFEDTASNALTGFEYINYINQSGNGFKMSVGLQFKPIHEIRIGLAYHSPTWYTIDYRVQSSMRSSFDNGDNYSMDTDPGYKRYRFSTPERIVAGLAIVMGKAGFLSIDYIWQDFSNSKFKSNTLEFLDFNRQIQNDFAARSELRLGAEINAGPAVFRLGGGVQSSPFTYANNFDTKANYSREYGSLGIGYKLKQVNLDFSILQYRTSAADELLYSTSSDVVYAFFDEKKTRIGLSLVYKF